MPKPKSEFAFNLMRIRQQFSRGFIPNTLRQLSISLVMTALVAWSYSASAEVITMEPKTTVELDSSHKTLAISLQLTNKGDEAARDVVLELPDFNLSENLTEELAPLKLVRKSISVPANFLNDKSTSGLYILLGRIRYKDLNAYPFSVPFSIEVPLPPLPSQMLLTRVENSDPSVPIDISSKVSVNISVRNISSAAVQIDSVRALSPAEILSQHSQIQLPRQLEPSTKVDFTVELENAGALAGSTYFLPIIFSGTSQGRHFAEMLPVRLKIISPLLPPKLLILFGIIAISVVSILAWYRRKNVA